jgi:putative RNA 2'-phosphotransferase
MMDSLCTNGWGRLILPGTTGKARMTKQISKFLALILRHKPAVGDLVLDGEGWADVDAVLAAIRSRFGDFGQEQLEELVRTNDKRRYTFNETGERIRAIQGHSIPVDLKLEPALPPSALYHGTGPQSLVSILREGLVKGRRHHVHLSPDIETALKVGARRGEKPVILEVRSGEMIGHRFFRSANGVWLTDRVPPFYLWVLPPSEIAILQYLDRCALPTHLAAMRAGPLWRT